MTPQPQVLAHTHLVCMSYTWPKKFHAARSMRNTNTLENNLDLISRTLDLIYFVYKYDYNLSTLIALLCSYSQLDLHPGYGYGPLTPLCSLGCCYYSTRYLPSYMPLQVYKFTEYVVVLLHPCCYLTNV